MKDGDGSGDRGILDLEDGFDRLAQAARTYASEGDDEDFEEDFFDEEEEEEEEAVSAEGDTPVIGLAADAEESQD